METCLCTWTDISLRFASRIRVVFSMHIAILIIMFMDYDKDIEEDSSLFL